MSALFSIRSEKACDEYKRLSMCPSPDSLDGKLKAELEKMWTAYESLSDPFFLTRFPVEYWQRIWEMSLAVALLNNGCTLVRKRRADGPDLRLETKDGFVNIEAVCPIAGDEANPNAVPGLSALVFQEVRFDLIEMRLQKVIAFKALKYHDWIRDGIVDGADTNVIAVSASQLPWASFAFGEDIALNLLRAVLPIGPEVGIINRQNGSLIGYRRTYKLANQRSSGFPVEKTFFLTDNNAHISALIYSVGKYPSVVGRNHDSITFIANPHATRKLTTNLGFREITITIGEDSVQWSTMKS
jgi:hypothetical protein